MQMKNEKRSAFGTRYRRLVYCLMLAGGVSTSLAAESGLSNGHRDDATSPATTDEGQARSASDVDSEFLSAAANFSDRQVAAAEIVLHETGNSDVQAYAGRMSIEHKKLAEALHSVSVRHQIPLPGDVTQKQDLKSLASKQLPAIDRRYLEIAGSRELRRIINVYEDESRSGQMSDARKFAQAALPMLNRQLTMAGNLEKKVFPK